MKAIVNLKTFIDFKVPYFVENPEKIVRLILTELKMIESQNLKFVYFLDNQIIINKKNLIKNCTNLKIEL